MAGTPSPRFDYGHVCKFVGITLLLSWIFAGHLPAQWGEWPVAANKVSSHEDRPSNVMVYSWWSHLTWDSLYYETNAYAPNGLLQETTHFEFVPGQGLLKRFKWAFEYDSQDRRVLATQLNWNGSAFTNFYRAETYYDGNGKDSVDYQYYWAQTVSGYDWDTVDGLQHLITYAPGGEMTQEVYAVWTETTSGSYWLETSKNEFHYATNGELDSTYFYHFSNGAWMLDGRRVDYQWHDYGMNQVASYTVQLPGGGWNDWSRIGCTYNGIDSDCTTENFVNSVWDSTSIRLKRYDTAEHLILEENRIHQQGLWTLDEGTRYNYAYDSLGSTIEMFSEVWQHGIQNYRQDLKYVYGSNFVGTEPSAMLELSMQVYPNPAADLLSFDLGEPSHGPVTIQLVDLTGHLRLDCRSAAIGSKIEVELPASLETGTYIYRVTTAKGQATGKVSLLGR